MNEFISKIKNSASMELMAKAQEMKARGLDIIGLGGGEPDFDTPDAIKKKAIEEIERGNTHYAIGKGILKLRERISEKLNKENNINVSPDEVIVTPGGKMAIYLAVDSLINVGDEVMVLNPAWVSYDEIVVLAGGVPVNVPLDSAENYKITEEILEKYVSEATRAIIINSPNNPTGRVIDQDEFMCIKRFVLKHDLKIISDEIYEKIVFDGHKVLSPASDSELRDRTVTVNGFSKGYAMTGWRLGYLASDINMINTIMKIYTHTITGTSPFIQEAAVVALDCAEDCERMRQEYEYRRNRFVGLLKQIKGVDVKMPEGAFYAWAKIDYQGMKSYEIADLLLHKAHVIGVPGQAYGFSGDNYIRFSFANSLDDLNEAAKRIKNALEF